MNKYLVKPVRERSKAPSSSDVEYENQKGECTFRPRKLSNSRKYSDVGSKYHQAQPDKSKNLVYHLQVKISRYETAQLSVASNDNTYQIVDIFAKRNKITDVNK